MIFSDPLAVLTDLVVAILRSTEIKSLAALPAMPLSTHFLGLHLLLREQFCKLFHMGD